MAKINVKMNTTQFMLDNDPPADRNETPRGYLGMSGLAAECTRSLWYGFRFASTKKFSRRVLSIFERGDWEEHRTIRDLKSIGINVFRRDKDGKIIDVQGHVGEEQESLVGFAGHAKGHPDGRCTGVIEAPKTEHLLEIKTMNDKSFKNTQKNGVKIAHPVYYGQMQRYMDAMDLTRALFVARNKNDENKYVERVKFDKNVADELKQREYNIIASDSPYGNKFVRSWFACKWCDHFAVCQDDAPPQKTCRSCDHVDLAMDGLWVCGLKDDKELSIDDQMKACKHYKRLF